MSPVMSPPINALSPHMGGGGQIPPCVNGLGKTLGVRGDIRTIESDHQFTSNYF